MIIRPLQCPPSSDRTRELCSRVIQALAQDEQPMQSDIEDLLVVQTKLLYQRRFGLSLQWANMSRLLELLVPLAFDAFFKAEEVMAEAA